MKSTNNHAFFEMQDQIDQKKQLYSQEKSRPGN